MNALLTKLSPGATTQIRMDHAHVLATFHKYRFDASVPQRRAIVGSICLALEIHAKLEEEIFYPAMRSVDPDLVDKSLPEHNEMRRLIARLRETGPADPVFEQTFMELMRDVIRHVADEETMMLPDAERVLGPHLDELGARMTKRRLELLAPRTGQVVAATVRAFPGPALAMGGLLVMGALIAGRALTDSGPPHGRSYFPRRLRARLFG